ncbi:hypothetical protein EAG_15956 [Camponotus floridanus]|uniref:Uncharacterized protein n=1 Tax=Camponotus floridanus TaxID=104421 RepID=E2AES0_CAMFO|nr:hypothetical protein EAG_15956 [Camponotus floridanus]
MLENNGGVIRQYEIRLDRSWSSNTTSPAGTSLHERIARCHRLITTSGRKLDRENQAEHVLETVMERKRSRRKKRKIFACNKIKSLVSKKEFSDDSISCRDQEITLRGFDPTMRVVNSVFVFVTDIYRIVTATMLVQGSAKLISAEIALLAARASKRGIYPVDSALFDQGFWGMWSLYGVVPFLMKGGSQHTVHANISTGTYLVSERTFQGSSMAIGIASIEQDTSTTLLWSRISLLKSSISRCGLDSSVCNGNFRLGARDVTVTMRKHCAMPSSKKQRKTIGSTDIISAKNAHEVYLYVSIAYVYVAFDKICLLARNFEFVGITAVCLRLNIIASGTLWLRIMRNKAKFSFPKSYSVRENVNSKSERSPETVSTTQTSLELDLLQTAFKLCMLFCSDQRILRYPLDKSGFRIALPALLLQRIGLHETFEGFALYKRNDY